MRSRTATAPPGSAGGPSQPVPRTGYRIGRGYSRFVALAKRLLPAVAVALLVLIAAWPRLQAALQSVQFSVPRLDLTDARKLRMVDARYTGVDRENRPFVLTADAAEQTPKLNDAVTLDVPKADLTTMSGSWVELSAKTGLYQPQPQLLDLFGSVELYQDKGNEFHSDTAHLDLAAGTADGDDPVTGQGPFGNVTAEGFTLLNRGETILFKGHATLELDPRPKAAP